MKFWAACSSDRPHVVSSSKRGVLGSSPSVVFRLDLPGHAPILSLTGPDEGIQRIQRAESDWEQQWGEGSPAAWGNSISLYDQADKAGDQRNGDPIADCFAVLAYEHGALLTLADGVNWGNRAKVAATAAVYGCMQHVAERIAAQHGALRSIKSSNVFAWMMEGVEAAQKLILNHEGTMSTLTTCLVTRMARSSLNPCYVAMVMIVGDSPAFVWRTKTEEVEEITFASKVNSHRDPRNCEGALGFANGELPDYENLTCCLTTVDEGDIVFITSDGVWDNFDPIIRKEAMASLAYNHTAPLPVLSPAECDTRARCTMQRVLKEHLVKLGQHQLNARDLCQVLVGHVYNLTQQQRGILEGVNFGNKNCSKHEVSQMIWECPGKLDHATVVAYQVGQLSASSLVSEMPRSLIQ